MSDPLREPGFLTKHQLPIVEAAGNFFLTACPGSGKTRTIGVRFARLIDDGLRVAATSYTNVGVEQVRSVVSGELGFTIPSDCFAGTLHSYFLRFVFYPFGHLAMGCTKRPRVRGDDASLWDDVVLGDNRIRAAVSKFAFRPDGSLRFRGSLPRGIATAEEALSKGGTAAAKMKQRAAAAGFASADDAMYWTLRVLQEHPDLATLIASRFHELQVDEAQDTSELQLACLEALTATERLESLVLVGDVEQSIYSFQGASPEGCVALAHHRKLTSMELAENHRSSQRICDVAIKFCSRTSPDRAVGKNADAEWSPELLLYERERPPHAVDQFRRRLGELGVEETQAAVLGRTNTLVEALNLESMSVDCSSRVLAIGRAASVMTSQGTLTRSHVLRVDRILAHVVFGLDVSDLDESQHRAVREASMNVLADLPPLDLDLQSWIKAMRQTVDREARKLADPPVKSPGHVLQAKATHASVSAATAFTSNRNQSLRAQTVHDVKGESRDAILVVADPTHRKGRDPQGVVWSRPLLRAAVPFEDAEELRIVFVALTRAAQYCALALPNDTDAEVIAAFHAAGFTSLPAES